MRCFKHNFRGSYFIPFELHEKGKVGKITLNHRFSKIQSFLPLKKDFRNFVVIYFMTGFSCTQVIFQCRKRVLKLLKKNLRSARYLINFNLISLFFITPKKYFYSIVNSLVRQYTNQYRLWNDLYTKVIRHMWST